MIRSRAAMWRLYAPSQSRSPSISFTRPYPKPPLCTLFQSDLSCSRRVHRRSESWS
jgi:hypothetical protein